MNSIPNDSDALRSRVIAVERELDNLKLATNVLYRAWPYRLARFIRHEYGFIGFVFVVFIACYYAVRYQVTPFHDFADPARSYALARTYTTIGDRMMATGRWEHARIAFDEALKLDPRNVQASYHGHLAQLLTFADPTVVDGALTQLAAEASDDPIILFAQGIVCTRRGQYHKAAELFIRSTDADPCFIGARINLGAVCLRLGDRAAYDTQARAAYMLDSNFSVAVNNMAFACSLRHDFPEAARLYRRMDTIDHSALTLWLLGTALLYCDRGSVETYLGQCVEILQSELPDSADECGGSWPVGYLPVDSSGALADPGFVVVTARSQKLACALASYGIYDALNGDMGGAEAKLDRAYALIARNAQLRQIVALQIESISAFASCDSDAKTWLGKITQRWGQQ